MKTKLTLITLIACAAAGTTFAADPVEAFRASSGTTTNSADTIYVGNTDWGSDSKEIGEKYFKDLSLSHGGTSFTWDEDKKAFYNGFENLSFDTIFALTGTASFVNESNTFAVFRYAGDKKERDGDMGYENTILFADSSKFENRGEFLMEFEVSDAWSAPRFVTWLRDDAVFENSGLISSDYRYSGFSQSFRPALYYFLLAGNSKLINTESGEIRIRNKNNPSNDELDFFRVHIYENSTFENAGTVRLNVAQLAENGCFLNTGTVVSNSGAIEFWSREGWSEGTPRVENRGEMTVPNIKFNYYSEELAEGSALVENYGTWSGSSSSGWTINIGIDYDGDASTFSTTFKGIVAASDLQVKNYGTMDGNVQAGSFVKLTLAEGSKITGDLTVGSCVELSQSGSSTWILADKDVLGIELTGTGGETPLVAGNLRVENMLELNVSFGEEAVQKNKYTITLWGGDLQLDTDKSLGTTYNFLNTSGTLDAFDTTYIWSLDTATGVLTAKDVNFSEKVTVTSSTQSVLIGPKDVATIDASLTEYSGKLVGSGEVRFGANLTFTGDASGFSGTTKISGGTLTIAETAQLGTGAFELSDGGVLKVDEGVTLSSNVTILVSGTDFYVSDAALIGDGTFSGTVTLDAMLAEAVALAGIEARSTTGALTYKIFGEDLDHSGADVRLSDALLEAGWTLTMNADGTVSVSLIPEPSAFGALAGLGALALVASRRRRK